MRSYLSSFIAASLLFLSSVNADLSLFVEPLKTVAEALETNRILVQATADAADSITAASITITIPTGMTYVSDTGGGDTSESGGVITWTPSGGPLTNDSFFIDVTIDSGFDGETLTLVGTIDTITGTNMTGVGNSVSSTVQVQCIFLDWSTIALSGGAGGTGSTGNLDNTLFSLDLAPQGVDVVFEVEDFGAGNITVDFVNLANVGIVLDLDQDDKTPLDPSSPTPIVNPAARSEVRFRFDDVIYPNGIKGISFFMYDVDRGGNGSFVDGIIVYGLNDDYGVHVYPSIAVSANTSVAIPSTAPPIAFGSNGGFAGSDVRGRVTYSFGAQAIRELVIVYYKHDDNSGAAAFQSVQVSNLYRNCPLPLELQVTVDGSSDPFVCENDTTVVSISVSNVSADDSQPISATINLPSSLTYISDDSGGSFNPVTGMWDIGQVNALESETINITVSINPGTVGSNIVINGELNDPYGTLFPYGAPSITFSFSPVNPSAYDNMYSTDSNTPLVVSAPGVLANDISSLGLPLFVSSFSQPQNGSVLIDSNGSFTYTPNLNFSGIDSFTYTASNTYCVSTATVFVSVTGWASTIEPGSVLELIRKLNN